MSEPVAPNADIGYQEKEKKKYLPIICVQALDKSIARYDMFI